jgi:hypothetical protein
MRRGETVSESRVRENCTHGSKGGRWGGGRPGRVERAPEGKPEGLSPSDLQTAEEPAAYLTARVARRHVG